MRARRALCTTEPSLLQTLVKGKQNDFMLLTLSSLCLIEAPSVVPMGSWGPGEQTPPRATDAKMEAR